MKHVTREQVRCRCMGKDDCKENREVKFLDGSSLPSIPYLGKGDYHQGEWSKNEPCHNCHCLPGRFHHPGCDMEVCPRCKQQAIQCNCLNDWRAQERQEEQMKRNWKKQQRVRLIKYKLELRERKRQILKHDAEHRHLKKKGCTLLCNGGPALVDFDDDFNQEILSKNCVQKNDVVQCPTTYDGDGKLIPGEISLWAKVPKLVARRSKKTFRLKQARLGTDRARWTVWYEGHADTKGYGLTKEEAIHNLRAHLNFRTFSGR